MKTGAHLRVQEFSDSVQGVQLFGDKRRPEPEYFRLKFPGGDVDLSRLDDGSYWVHLRVNRPDDGGMPDERVFAQIVDARLDVRGKHAAETDPGDFKHPGLYHVALRVKVQP
jgi:hypothetical protein